MYANLTVRNRNRRMRVATEGLKGCILSIARVLNSFCAIERLKIDIQCHINPAVCSMLRIH